MASEEQIELAKRIKNIHKNLRDLSRDIGSQQAWELHLQDEATRQIYADSMRQLASEYWCKNVESEDRIRWTVDYCVKYFTEERARWYEKDLRSIEYLKIDGTLPPDHQVNECDQVDVKNLQVLDVGSSGNFFRNYENFNVLPIDISPSDSSVFNCDFLNVKLGESLQKQQQLVDHANRLEVIQLPHNHFHVVIFSLLLEYLPSSDLRVECCLRAYKVLQPQGVLVVITPDSNCENRNSKLVKHWRWTLASIGFRRVKLTKLKNLTCMAFRKSLSASIGVKWAATHRENYMTELKIEIPQDTNKEL